MSLSTHLSISPAVQAALDAGKPVVALESTIITHGMPYPQNLTMAQDVEKVIERNGATPATIAIMDGKFMVGTTAADLERLARTYWRFLTRVTLGLIRVRYTERERFVVLVAPPLRLLTFAAPEYEMDASHGIVRWRISRGLLVSKRGRDGRGHLQIEVRRPSEDGPVSEPASPRTRLHVEVEVVETGRFAVVTDLQIATDRRNLVVRGFEALHPADHFEFRIRSTIPLSGGLGSSAAAYVAGLMAADHLFELDADVLALATKLEGHPDNVAAALCGGFVICADEIATRFDAPAGLEAVLVVPDVAVRTREARLLPDR